VSRADSDPRLLDRLREWRVPTVTDRSINPEIGRLVREVQRRTTAVGGFDEIWSRVVPPDLAANSHVQRLTSAGDLHVVAADSSTRYAIDVWLRSGGLMALRNASKRGVRSVKLK